ncbi:Phosphoinositide phosphatase SAC8 [Vitis vinifera]|uniref:Phosphoinositide phosphatase SAC8 n=1 Tax=Vitis vinifera TaxID=29760 RepID=A0A438DAN2_VITVI|nr:Phosphoinositide phosphatase SAC8 [Vitis vinifera]
MSNTGSVGCSLYRSMVGSLGCSPCGSMVGSLGCSPCGSMVALSNAGTPHSLNADPRFVWNRNIMEELIECKLDRFIIPLLQGNILKLFMPCAFLFTYLCVCMCAQAHMLITVFSFNQSLSFQTAQLKLKKSPATITLISRRCTRRLGTRMWRRGANLEGDTANFIETEQLLEFEGFKTSFLQVFYHTRGAYMICMLVSFYLQNYLLFSGSHCLPCPNGGGSISL